MKKSANSSNIETNNDDFFIKNIRTLTNNYKCDFKKFEHRENLSKKEKLIEAYIRCNNKTSNINQNTNVNQNTNASPNKNIITKEKYYLDNMHIWH